MASLEMLGPHSLSATEIDTHVTKKSIGNYALGYVREDGAFIVQYVGRSDIDLNARLKQHATVGKYTMFKYSYAKSKRAAFEKECQNFHDFGGTENLGNDIHPDRPAGSEWKCPYCSNFD
jgi:chaperonin GroEL (HSP60 family)